MPNINIMLVDDEERFLSTTKKLLERKGYKVETASSGMAALDKLKNHSIQVVILDVKMPGMDGITTLKKIKRAFPLIEVIMLTGHGTVESAVEGVKLGAANYLIKPADIDDISQKIQEAFEKRQTISTQTDKRKTYFKKLKMRLGLGLMAAFMLPYAVFFAYFQFQFSATLKNTGRLNLEALSNSQKNTIDLFLQERVVNIFSLFHSLDFSLNPSQDKMQNFLRDLRQVNDAFIDVGFLNTQGVQTGYAGPFPYLKDKDYSDENWFKTLLNQERHYYISNIYHGFRDKPHFTIAVRQIIDGYPYIMRSTLDPDKFYMFLRSINRGKEVEASLINKEGLYQIVDPDRGELLGKSEYIPPLTTPSGVMEIKKSGDAILIGYAWLKETPWALIVCQPLNIAHAKMYQSRRIMTISLAIVFIAIAIGIWFANSRMIDHARGMVEKKDELRHQLFHASKLASVGELATGVAHEINNAGDDISGPGKITITTTRNDSDIQIMIKDTGKGMSAEQLNEIFNPFFTTKEVGKGTGLGLSVSLNIVEALGGVIDVQSSQGAGSSFIISLPIHRA
jgi:ActR/RegA family two-component response regulator